MPPRTSNAAASWKSNFPDKKWQPGEELEFSLTTPFTGAGLITVERDAVLTEMWFQCDSKSSVQKIRLPGQPRRRSLPARRHGPGAGLA